MFDRIYGEILLKEQNRVVVDVGGVGYEMLVPSSTSSALPDKGKVLLFVYDIILNSEKLSLYGFASERERVLFRLLLSVNGVGPQTALQILSRCSPERLLEAVSNNKPQILQAAKGIGKKISERIVLELSERVRKLGLETTVSLRPSFEDAVSALISLGYSRPQASSAVERAFKTLGSEATLEDVIKESLRSG
ncbi:MAG: Holliday junction branch migration protein RuvA [Planctomycetota bacterium]|nr:Holliday junction branch migration protein RuvA [Planctomycetota bacterium]